MKTELKVAVFLCLSALFFGAAYDYIPALRARVLEQSQAWLGWTEAARQADPVGFTNHVEKRLKEDLESLKQTRTELTTGIGTLGREIREQQAMLEHAEKLAQEFRDAYQTAVHNGKFPVTIRNAAYTEDQTIGQVSMLVAEAEGYRETLAKFKSLHQTVESRLEDVTVRLTRTESQLAMIGTECELLRARVLTDEAQHLVAELDELLDGNVQVVKDNPVRSVEELLATLQVSQSNRSNLDKARAYLSTKPNLGNEQITAEFESIGPTTSAGKVNKPAQLMKPIFEQR